MRLHLMVALLFVCFVCSSAALEAVGVKNTLYNIPGLGGKPLTVKNYPAIENYQSNLYEIYAEPYNYQIGPTLAVAVLSGEGESDVKGEILFLQKHPPIGPVFVRGNITGLAAGKHGIHIHRSGDLRKGCEKLGGHFNPFSFSHGGPRDALRHVGDLGNVEASAEGIAEVAFVDGVISLGAGPRGVVGRALVVAGEADDFGRAGDIASAVDGNAGRPLACGIIAYVR